LDKVSEKAETKRQLYKAEEHRFTIPPQGQPVQIVNVSPPESKPSGRLGQALPIKSGKGDRDISGKSKG